MRTRSPLFKYQIGLGILGLITAGFMITLVVLAGSSKQDTKTYESATEIADKLNNYVSTHGEIPDSLQTTGMRDVPKTISYQKLDEKSYRFCVTYKTDSGTVDASTAINDALTGFYGGYNYGSYESDDYLFIDSNYSSGENCQTIRPMLSSDSNSGSYWDENGLTTDTICGKSYSFSLDRQEVKKLEGSKITVHDFIDTEYDLGANAKIYDANCKELSTADISTGNKVTLYFDTNLSAITAIKKE